MTVSSENDDLLLEEGEGVSIPRTRGLGEVNNVHEVMLGLFSRFVLLLLRAVVSILVLDHLDRVTHRFGQGSLQTEFFLPFLFHLELVQQVLLVLATHLALLLCDGIHRLLGTQLGLSHLLGLAVRRLEVLVGRLDVDLLQRVVAFLLLGPFLVLLLLLFLHTFLALHLTRPVLFGGVLVLVDDHPLEVGEVIVEEVVLLFGKVFYSSKEVHLVLEHHHCMATPSTRPVVLALHLVPLLALQVEAPEVIQLVVPVHPPENEHLVPEQTHGGVAPAAGTRGCLRGRGRVEQGSPARGPEVEQVQAVAVSALLFAEASEDKHVVVLGQGGTVRVQGVDSVLLGQEGPFVVVETEDP